ncbi:MAG: hypothetical protein RIB98_17670 [Acidimicrobiales bacterium]
MQQRTGSVYLDAPPRPSRVPAVNKNQRLRTRSATVLVGIGIVALTTAMAIIGLRMIALDTGATSVAFETALDDPVARAELEREVAAGIEQDLVGPEMAEIAAVYGLDVAEEAERIAPGIVDDPAVQTELRVLAEELHSRMLDERENTAVELGPLTEATLDVIARESPRLATVVPEDAALWVIEPESLRDLTGTVTLLNRLLLLSLLPILLIPAGLAIHPHRHRVAGAIGRWGLAFGLTGALAAIGLPYAAGAYTGFTSVEIVVRATSLKLLAPSVVTGVIGMGLVSLAAFLGHREQRRVAQEGADAALGYDEPPFGHRAGDPLLDLSSRGLVDVNHPLTNI